MSTNPSQDGTKAGEDTSSSILRGIATLVGLAEAGRPVAFGVLASALQMPPSTVHRILRTLCQSGYAVQDPTTGSYSPGSAFLRASTLFCSGTSFPATVESALAAMVEQSGESAFYGSYLSEMQRFRFLAQLYSEHAVHYVLRKDKNYSLLWGASGRSIAAFLPEKTLQAIYEREKLEPQGNAPLPDWASFKKEMALIRAAGYCTTYNQRFEGAHAVAAPILGSGQRVVGCIGISMPSDRRDEGKIEALGALVMRWAQELSFVAQCAIDKPQA
jgi:DNA-binding IclR family transcriptional regulator